MQEVEAIYEGGVLKPTRALALHEGERVLVNVQPVETTRGDQGAEDQESELLGRLEAEGALERQPSTEAPAGFRPVVVRGEPLSETILRARR